MAKELDTSKVVGDSDVRLLLKVLFGVLEDADLQRLEQSSPGISQYFKTAQSGA